ncbi:hypothetical protein NH340_JMT01113 [Sarcoptes scabiei]|nr:hypothetical protein NH340_JMT01113 [Sarcoptes scabiei]
MNQSRLNHSPKICLDINGTVIEDGQKYLPLEMDVCTECTCTDGKADMCITELCSIPDNCRKYHRITNKCCKFVCLDQGSIVDGRISSIVLSMRTDFNQNETIRTAAAAEGTTKRFHLNYDLGIRLISNTISLSLILALLLYLILRIIRSSCNQSLRRANNQRFECYLRRNNRFDCSDSNKFVSSDLLNDNHQLAIPNQVRIFYKFNERILPPPCYGEFEATEEIRPDCSTLYDSPPAYEQINSVEDSKWNRSHRDHHCLLFNYNIDV